MSVIRASIAFAYVTAAAAVACVPPRGSGTEPALVCAEDDVLPPGADADKSTLVVTSRLDAELVLGPQHVAAGYVFARAYQTLVGRDCNGRLVPSVAQSWQSSGGGSLVLRINDSARFWNGAGVTATTVIEGWRATADALDDPLVALVADSSRALTGNTIEVRVAGVGPDWLTAPSFAVVRRTGFGIPEGTGRMRLVEADWPGARDPSMRRFALSALPGDAAHTQYVVAADRRNARDAIDVDAGVVLSSDPAVTAYAEARFGTAASPLDWDRTWILAVPSRVDAAGGDDAAGWNEFRTSLARDVGGADARAIAFVPALAGARLCAPQPSVTHTPVFRDRVTIAYPLDDPMARAIAERLAGLSGGAGRGNESASVLPSIAPVLRIDGMQAAAIGLDRAAFAAALREQSEFAFVLSVPSRPVGGCADGLPSLRGLPWLAGADGVLRTSTIVPLFETRWRVAQRPSR